MDRGYTSSTTVAAGWVVLLAVAIIVALPASSGTSIKGGLLLVATFGCLLAALASGDWRRIARPAVWVFLGLAVALVLRATATLWSGEAPPMLVGQASIRYAALLVLVGLGHAAMSMGWFDFARLARVVLTAHAVYLVAKVGFIGATSLAGFGYHLSAELFGVLAPGATIHGFHGEAILGRYYLGNDILTPYLLALVAARRRFPVELPPWFRTAFAVLALTSILFTFTRLVWALAVFLVLLVIALWPRDLDRRRLARGLLATLGAIVLTGIIVFGPRGSGGGAQAVMDERVSDVTSLQEKILQVELMATEFWRAPLLGRGIGFYLVDHVRDERLPFQYEVQWMALLMQTGVAGALAVLAALLVLIMPAWRRLLAHEVRRTDLLLVVFLGSWLAASATNPYLFVLVSGVFYLLVAGAARLAPTAAVLGVRSSIPGQSVR